LGDLMIAIRRFRVTFIDLLISEFGDRMIEFKFNNGNSI
jgi:hypothetical protein